MPAGGKLLHDGAFDLDVQDGEARAAIVRDALFADLIVAVRQALGLDLNHVVRIDPRLNLHRGGLARRHGVVAEGRYLRAPLVGVRPDGKRHRILRLVGIAGDADLVKARLFHIGLAQHDAPVKDDRAIREPMPGVAEELLGVAGVRVARPEHRGGGFLRLFGDRLVQHQIRRREIALHLHHREAERLAHGVESLRPAILRQGRCQIEIRAEKVIEGVLVFPPVQSPQHGPLPGLVRGGEIGGNGAEEGPQIPCLWPALFFRRHFAGLHPVEEAHPLLHDCGICQVGAQRGEIETALGDSLIVTLEAVPLEKGVQLFGIKSQSRISRGGNQRHQAE
jgi:hypothetical protein